MGEVHLAAILCAFLSGSEAEDRQYFDVNGINRFVRVDCSTQTHVIEIGLDGKASARDSVHQAVFASELTGKRPVVILIDRDGFEGRFEYETRIVTESLGIPYASCTEAFLNRWQMTAPFRGVSLDKNLNDLPKPAAQNTTCTVDEIFGVQSN